MEEKMRILGIDPGFAITGYSIIDYSGNKFKLITSGAVTTKAGEPFPLRLTKIYDELTLIINEYKPDNVVVEELFFNQNVKTAINVAQARGVVLLLGCKNNLPTFEYTPLQVKQAVVGYGRAEKKQVQKMVQTILNIEEVPKLDDITDSMAVAICHAHSAKFAVTI
jgi:crossover junction endodeoxyribonuclease RuvC